jgi:hypothetical protein
VIRRGRENRSHLPGRSAQFAQEPSIKPKVNLQPLGNSEDKLPMRHRSTNFPAHPERRLQGPFLVATGAKTTASAGIRHEEFVRTIRTTHPRKALLPVAS